MISHPGAPGHDLAAVLQAVADGAPSGVTAPALAEAARRAVHADAAFVATLDRDVLAVTAAGLNADLLDGLRVRASETVLAPLFAGAPALCVALPSGAGLQRVIDGLLPADTTGPRLAALAASVAGETRGALGALHEPGPRRRRVSQRACLDRLAPFAAALGVIVGTERRLAASAAAAVHASLAEARTAYLRDGDTAALLRATASALGYPRAALYSLGRRIGDATCVCEHALDGARASASADPGLWTLALAGGPTAWQRATDDDRASAWPDAASLLAAPVARDDGAAGVLLLGATDRANPPRGALERLASVAELLGAALASAEAA